MALGRSPPPEIRSPEERGAAEAVSEEEEVFDDAFDIPHKNAPHDRLRRWRQAALVLNASRRFRYTLDLKKEEEKEIIRRKIRSHAQVIRAAFLFKEAGQKDIRGMTTRIPFMGIDPPPCRADHGIKKGKSEWVIATPASHHAIRKHIHTGFIIDHDDSFIHAVDGIPMKLAELHYSVRIGCSQCCIKGLFASCSPRQHSRQAGISAPGVRNRTHWTPGSTAWARQYFQATKQTSPNGAGDGMIVGTAHNRGIDSCSKDDYLQATQRCVHMMNGAEGTADQPMHAVFIIDSAAALHCTGDRILLSEYAENKQPDGSISGASGTVMPILGVGSICNGRFQVKDVKYMPSLNRPNINKTIFSVRELVKLGYSVHFSGAHCLVMDNRKFTWSWKTWKRTPEVVGEAHLEHGQFMVDYLRIPADRTPATTSERETLAASFWKAASSGWTSMTGLMTHQKAGARRPPV